MKRFNFIRFVFCFVFLFCVVFCGCFVVYGGISDCLWGGSNEQTAYTTPYVHSVGTSLSQANQPPMNIGAPVPAIPVQATPASRATLVPQPNVPTISPITGSVGT
ncbi:MAG: hypothetical protein LBQ66_16350, partial [Planctomycetaceae bacterium]|nr:hypothetical protein [Planctomycetaceae bacterium]